MKGMGLVFLLVGLLVTSLAVANRVYAASPNAEPSSQVPKFQQATASFTPYLGFSIATIGLAISLIARREQ